MVDDKGLLRTPILYGQNLVTKLLLCLTQLIIVVSLVGAKISNIPIPGHD